MLCIPSENGHTSIGGVPGQAAPAHYLFIGGDNYTVRAQTLIMQTELRQVINARNLSHVETVALLHHVDLFIGTDSGRMNRAVAVATPAFSCSVRSELLPPSEKGLESIAQLIETTQR